MAGKTKISPVHWGVILIGFPVMAICGVLAAYWYEGPRPDHELGAIFVAALVASTALTLLVAGLESRRLSGDTRNGPKFERQHALMDMSFWQVGDRGAWLDNGVHVGTVVEAHRRPFEYEGTLVDAFAGAPGLVLADDAGGYGTVSNGMLYRLAGTSGPSGTIDSIRDEMNAAVSVGDGTSWIDPKGDVQEGTILEIKYEPFEVAGKRVDASRKFPGYVIARKPDGVHVAVSDKLREGV